MNLQNKIEQQMKRFDEKFPFIQELPEYVISRDEAKSFLSSSQQELIQEVVRMCEGRKETRHTPDCLVSMGIDNCCCVAFHYNRSLQDIIAELEKLTPKHI